LTLTVCREPAAAFLNWAFFLALPAKGSPMTEPITTSKTISATSSTERDFSSATTVEPAQKPARPG
jgi:hypothetical protein